MANVDADPGPDGFGSTHPAMPVANLGDGVGEALVRRISTARAEPAWMLDFRRRALAQFRRLPVGEWSAAGALGAPGAFAECLVGVEAAPSRDEGRPAPAPLRGVTSQQDSEGASRRQYEELAARGVVVCDLGSAVRDHPTLVQRWLGSVTPPGESSLSALNAAVWSDGAFVYVPPGVTVDVPLQMGAPATRRDEGGPVERTLIVADEGSRVSYIDGCAAPVYTSRALHSSTVELVALPGSRVAFTSVQNWSGNVQHLATVGARVAAEALVEVVEGSFGSQRSESRTTIGLVGSRARGEYRSVACAGLGQCHDAAAEVVHSAPDTTSLLVGRSIARDGGTTAQRGRVRVERGARGAQSSMRCDALLLDAESAAQVEPAVEVHEHGVQISHGGKVTAVDDGQVFYLRSRGLPEHEAVGMVVNGFIEPVTRAVPLEYAVEWSRLVELQIAGSIG